MIPSRQTKAPLERLNLNITAREAIGLMREMQDGDLTVDLPYQRGSVWNDGQRIELVRSWQTGTPIPAVITALYLRVNGSGTPQTAEDMARAAGVAAR